MKKILCVIAILLFCGSGFAGETHGSRKLYKTIIETKEKKSVIEKIVSDMEKEGYSLVEKSDVKFVFDSPFKNGLAGFGFSLRSAWWGVSGISGDDWLEWVERRPPVYRLEWTVIMKTTKSVEVEVCPILIWNPGIAFQKDIYDGGVEAKKFLENYLNLLKEGFENVS